MTTAFVHTYCTADNNCGCNFEAEDVPQAKALDIEARALPAGILITKQPMTEAQAAELMRGWAAHRPDRPVVLGPGMRFRQLLPDGTLEPEPTELDEIVVEPDYQLLLLGLAGWVVALVAVLFR